jgi:hypothetical protein
MRMRPPRPARAALVTALVSGVAMIGASVHGMLGIDRQLERSAQAATHVPAVHDFRIRDVYCPHPAGKV